MNFVHISLFIHFVWLIWLSVQFYDHDEAIERIMRVVLDRFQPRNESTAHSHRNKDINKITGTSRQRHLSKIEKKISNIWSDNPKRNKNQDYTNNPGEETNDRVPSPLPSSLSDNDKVDALEKQFKPENYRKTKIAHAQSSDGTHQALEMRDNGETNLMWRRTKIHKDFDPFTTYTGWQTQAHISRNLASSSKIDETSQNNNHMKDLRRRNRVQNDYAELNRRLEYNDDHNTTTTCILLGDDSVDIDDQKNNTAYFDLTMDLMTDARVDEISFKLLQKDGLELAIDSANDVNLSPNTLHKLEYKCFVSNIDQNDGKNYPTQQQQQKNEMCYLFKLYDPRTYSGGQCCEFGLGYFEVSVNNSPVSFGTNRFYGTELSASFCINEGSGIVTQQEIETKNETSLYPSRECKNQSCVCDTNPVIFSTLEHNNMHGIKMNVLTKIMLLSDSENLIDVSSPEYRAACWVLLDDPYEYSEQKEAALEKTIEYHMIQRYILAMFYFATNPGSWKLHYNFLSSRSECMWNSVEEFYRNEQNFICGCICDNNENVISITFRSNNLHGTLIDEIFGLNKLEKIHIYDNPDLHGTIPSTIGRLSNLQALEIYHNALEGTIPEQLFNATNLQKIVIGQNKLTGTLPKSIGKLQRLSFLRTWSNGLTGPIPEELYSIESLVIVVLGANRFSGSISQSIGNLKNLEWFAVDQNELTGTVPSTINKLSRLIVSGLNDNRLSGPIPKISMSNLGYFALHNNEMTGTVSSDICNIETLAPDSKTVEKKYPGFYFRGITSDCRNDVLLPQVECSCCSYCQDKSPAWSSDCADTTIMIQIHHKPRGSFYGNSDDLVWSLVDNTSGNPVVHDGRYDKYAFGNNKEIYKACDSSAGCYSLVMKHPPVEDTNYTIFWNGESILKGTFKGYMSNNYNNSSVKDVVMASFYYDEFEDKVISDSFVCPEREIMCFGEAIHLNTKHHVMYNTALKVSGSSKLSDESSVHSKALCWIMMNDSQYYDTDIASLGVMFTQRYVLTLLHLMSVNGLFGFDEFPPLPHECAWEGIECSDRKTLTKLSFPDMNQMIDGPLIDEIGSLAFLEVLKMDYTMLKGSIPHTFSNLYSLKELDLSHNNLIGSIENTFFDRLQNLEYLNLINNGMTGMIPANIGLYSNIKTIRLKNNRFTGDLPLDGFTQFSLEHLDISQNQLSGIISPSLLKHVNIEYLNLGENLFVGSLAENIFDELINLKYFNVSKNELTGIIPPFPHNVSNITHYDMHANRITGTLPISLSKIKTLKYLNLQGNRITGSIPIEYNNLRNLHLLSLSHNQLKSSIPLDFDKLPKLKYLHLHANELSGKASYTNFRMEEYITDCGYPSVSLESIECPSCTICCNSENLCKSNTKSRALEYITAASMLLMIILLLLCYKLKDAITSNRQFFSERVREWNPMLLINEKSVYHFFLTKNETGWRIAFACLIIQIATLFLFVGEAVSYDMMCQPHSLECLEAETSAKISPYGFFLFAWILVVWLLRDFIGSIKLLLLSLEMKNIDYMFASGMILLVTVLSTWTSVYYNLVTVRMDTELIVNTVILLFILEEDERLYQLISSVNPSFVIDVERDMRESANFNGDDLIISSWIKKFSERFRKITSNISFQSKKREADNNDGEDI